MCQQGWTSIPSGLAPLNISEGRTPELRAFQMFQAQIFSTIEEHLEFGCLYQKLEYAACASLTLVPTLVFDILNLLQVRALMLASSVACLLYLG